MDKDDHAETDTSKQLGPKDTKIFQSFIECLQWAVMLGCIHAMIATMILSQFHPVPRLGHLECMKNVLGNLRKYRHDTIRLCTRIPEHEASIQLKTMTGTNQYMAMSRNSAQECSKAEGQARIDDNLHGCKFTVLLCHWSAPTHLLIDFLGPTVSRGDPFCLEGAIQDPDNVSSELLGQLTAVIQYRTAYTLPNGAPLILSFALGEHISTNTVFGLPLQKLLHRLWFLLGTQRCPSTRLPAPQRTFAPRPSIKCPVQLEALPDRLRPEQDTSRPDQTRHHKARQRCVWGVSRTKPWQRADLDQANNQTKQGTKQD